MILLGFVLVGVMVCISLWIEQALDRRRERRRQEELEDRRQREITYAQAEPLIKPLINEVYFRCYRGEKFVCACCLVDKSYQWYVCGDCRLTFDVDCAYTVAFRRRPDAHYVCPSCLEID